MLYGLIGEKLSHSFSKEIHESIADYKYELKELSEAELADFFKKREFKGINVTIPYKEKVIPYLDEISPEAESIGAVNTVVNRKGRLCGYNTDFPGLASLAEYAGIDMKNKKVLIFGTGGTSRTAMAVAEKSGAAEIIRVSRSGRETSVTYEEAYKRHSDAEIIINATPAGMYPSVSSSPGDLTHFKNLTGLIDVVYNPLRTTLALQAENMGVTACNGLYMLVAQAVYASALFTGGSAKTCVIDRIYRRILLEKQNIVLIGMPSSGKTTIGKILAESLGKKFTDTDEAIVSQIGMPISEYFDAYGEKAFRDMESRIIEQAAVKNGLVIATGGGAVLRKENVCALKRNGTVIFLDRSPELLTVTSDRPLSSNKADMMKRYNERYSLYLEAADMKADSNLSPAEVSQEIQRKFV